MDILQTIPLLRIFDSVKAREFYIDYMGFTIEWEHRFEENLPLYMQIKKEGCVLHLTEHHGDCCPGATVFLRVRGLERYHQELNAKSYAYMRPGLEKTFRNSLCMEVIDPFGIRLRLDESL